MAFEETGINVVPVNQEAVPVGSLAEAEAEGLDPGLYATCARPNKASGVVGCKWFDKCIVSAKGVAGPKNYGVRVFKGKSQGGAMVNTTANCMWIADQAPVIEKNGGALKVIAEEGETYKRVTGIAVNNMTGEATMNVRDPNTHRDDVVVEVLVQPWPRPGQNAELLTDLLRAEVNAEERKRRSDESLARNIGDPNAVVPIDKRDADKASGRSKAGK